MKAVLPLRVRVRRNEQQRGKLFAVIGVDKDGKPKQLRQVRAKNMAAAIPKLVRSIQKMPGMEAAEITARDILREALPNGKPCLFIVERVARFI